MRPRARIVELILAEKRAGLSDTAASDVGIIKYIEELYDRVVKLEQDAAERKPNAR